MDFYKNTIHPKPKHASSGEHRQFIGSWDENLQYSGDRLGNDVYCSNCDNWSTVKGMGILFSIIGNCKNCGQSFLEKNV